MAGHRYISSTERYQQDDLEDLFGLSVSLSYFQRPLVCLKKGLNENLSPFSDLSIIAINQYKSFMIIGVPLFVTIKHHI